MVQFPRPHPEPVWPPLPKGRFRRLSGMIFCSNSSDLLLRDDMAAPANGFRSRVIVALVTKFFFIRMTAQAGVRKAHRIIIPVGGCINLTALADGSIPPGIEQ